MFACIFTSLYVCSRYVYNYVKVYVRKMFVGMITYELTIMSTFMCTSMTFNKKKLQNK
jgi:hypothetical protein